MKKADRRLARAERDLNDEIERARTAGTIWDHAYAVGKRNGVRLAREILTGDPHAHHSETYELLEDVQ